MSFQIFDKDGNPLGNRVNAPTITTGIRLLGLKKGRINKNLQVNHVHRFTRGPRKGQEVRYNPGRAIRQGGGRPARVNTMYTLHRPDGDRTVMAPSATNALKKLGLPVYSRKKIINSGEFTYKRGQKAGWRITKDELPNNVEIGRRENGLESQIMREADHTYESGESEHIDVHARLTPEQVARIIRKVQLRNSRSDRLVVAIIHMLSTTGETGPDGEIKSQDLNIVMRGESWASRIDDLIVKRRQAHGSDVEMIRAYAVVDWIEFHDTEQYFLNPHRKMADGAIANFRRTREGSFFPFFNLNSKIDLSRQQIYSEEAYKVDFCERNCFLHAMDESGTMDAEELQTLKISFIKRNTSFKDVKAISKQFNLHFKINQRYGDKTKTYHINRKGTRLVALGLINGHWFYNCRIKGGYDAHIKHFDKLALCKEGQNKFSKSRGGRWLHDSAVKEIMAFRAINQMLDLRQFKAFDSEDLEKVGRFKASDKIEFLGHEDYNFKPVEYTEKTIKIKDGKKLINPEIIYADFETTTDGLFKAFAVSASNEDGSSRLSYYGKDCAVKLLNWLPNNSMVFFHNLTFDINFLIRELTGVTSMMRNGTQMKRMKANFGKKKLMFVDSYLYVPAPLSAFESYFPDVINGDNHKEIFPYDWFNETNTFSDIAVVDLDEVIPFIKDEDVQAFKANKLNRFGFDKVSYTKFYCDRDVEVLRLGLNAFRNGMKIITGMTDQEFENYNKAHPKAKISKKYVDPFAYVSLASFADAFLKRDGVYDGTFFLSGSPRAFIQKANLGGRVMVNSNIPIKVDDGTKILDYDAVSLYPSGMMTEDTILRGKPKILTAQDIEKMNGEQFPILPSMTDTFIEYDILDVKNELDFPLIYVRGKESIEYTNECARMITSGRYLNEIVKYHGASFNIIRGYYFDDGYNSRIKTVMRKLFNKRLEMKAKKNPIQVLFKLVMNSSYGINGLKFMPNEFRLINTKQSKNFIYKNASIINYFTKIDNPVNPKLTKFLFNLAKTREAHFNRVHISSSILDASKIIMSRVFNSANEAGCKVYYQDTDSIQVNAMDIPKIENKFAELYPDRLALRGTEPSQFHPDYELPGCKNVVGLKAIYLAKKVYMVKLRGESYETGEYVYGDHLRLKGVSAAAIKAQGGDPWDSYDEIYKGGEVVYDLTAKLSLEKLADFNIRKRETFTRRVALKPEVIDNLMKKEEYRSQLR